MFVKLKRKKMKAALILLLLAINLFGQKQVFQNTSERVSNFWRSPDTVGHYKNYTVINLKDPIIYYYNTYDSILVTPTYLVSKNGKEVIVIGLNIWIPEKFENINRVEFKIWAVDRSAYTLNESNNKFFKTHPMKNKILKDKTTKCISDAKGINVPFYAYYNPEAKNNVEYGSNYTGIFVEMQEQEMFTFDSVFGTQEIELSVNGKVIVPKQERKLNGFFEFRFSSIHNIIKNFNIVSGAVVQCKK